MWNDDMKAQRAQVWSRRFALMYAIGVWTVIAFFISRTVRFREIPVVEEKKEEKSGQSPPPPPLDHKQYSRSV